MNISYENEKKLHVYYIMNIEFRVTSLGIKTCDSSTQSFKLRSLDMDATLTSLVQLVCHSTLINREMLIPYKRSNTRQGKICRKKKSLFRLRDEIQLRVFVLRGNYHSIEQ